MNKLVFFLFPLFLFAQWIKFPYTIELKKDEVANFEVHYDKRIYPLTLRWTLFKNDILTLHYKYNDFPRQITLYKNPPLNTFRIKIANYPELYPYFLIEFTDFNDKIATFRIYLFNGKKVKVKRQ